MYTLKIFIEKIKASLKKSWDDLDEDPWTWIYDEDDVSVDVDNESYSINDIVAFGELYFSDAFQKKVKNLPDLLKVCNEFYEEYRVWTRARTGETDCPDETIESFFIVNVDKYGRLVLDVSLINFENAQPRVDENRRILIDYLDNYPDGQQCIDISLAETNETCSINFLAAVKQRVTFNQLIYFIKNSSQNSTIMISCVPDSVQITRLCQALVNNAYKISGLLFVDEFNTAKDNQAKELILTNFNYAKAIASSSQIEALPKDDGSKEHFSNHILRMLSKQINRLEKDNKSQSAIKCDAFKQLKHRILQVQHSGSEPVAYVDIFCSWEQLFLCQMAVIQDAWIRAEIPGSVEKTAKISKILRGQRFGETGISDDMHQKYYNILVKLSNRINVLMKKEKSTEIQTELEQLHNLTTAETSADCADGPTRKSTRSIKVSAQQLRINISQLTFFTRNQIKIHELTQLCTNLLALPLQERSAENTLAIIQAWNSRPKILPLIERRPSMWKSAESTNDTLMSQIIADLTALCPKKESAATATEPQKSTRKL